MHKIGQVPTTKFWFCG